MKRDRASAAPPAPEPHFEFCPNDDRRATHSISADELLHGGKLDVCGTCAAAARRKGKAVVKWR